MYIVNPDPYVMPSYRISPFRTIDISKNNELSVSSSIDDYFDERFGKKKYGYHYNARSAINKALAYYNLSKDDTVTILTTTNNFYISNCVTSEIEKFCNWSREISDTTKLLFVNHEFGQPYEKMEELKNYDIPIIEDCAHTFFSKESKSLIGTIGDFVIYSFPKMFPIQIGGLLVSNITTNVIDNDFVDNVTLDYIKKVVSHGLNEKEIIIQKRIEIYKKIRIELNELGFEERFELKEGIVPGVFMFKNNNNLDLNELKIYLYNNGIQCSVFYGEESFFIPCHQNLTDADIIYFKEVIKSFIKNRVV